MLHIKVRHDLLRQCVDHPGNKHLDQSSPDGFVYWIISPVIFTTSSTSRFCFPSPIRWYGSLLIIFKDNSLFHNQFLNLKKNNIRSNNFQLIMCCFCFIWEFLDRFYVCFFFALICYYIIFSNALRYFHLAFSLCNDWSGLNTLQTACCCHAETLKLKTNVLSNNSVISFIHLHFVNILVRVN